MSLQFIRKTLVVIDWIKIRWEISDDFATDLRCNKTPLYSRRKFCVIFSILLSLDEFEPNYPHLILRLVFLHFMLLIIIIYCIIMV